MVDLGGTEGVAAAAAAAALEKGVVVVLEALDVRLLNWGAWVRGAPAGLAGVELLTFLSQGFKGVAML